jgi:predicted RND superfamily exporter protein
VSAPAGFLRRLSGIGIRRPWPVLAVLLALSLLAVLGVGRLVIDGGAGRLAASDETLRQATLNITREFGSDRRSYVVVRDPQLWTPAKLKLLERLHGELVRLSFVERVDDPFSQHSVRSIDGRLELRPLIATLPVSVAEAERLRHEVVDDPLALHQLVSADGEALAIGLALREGTTGAASAAAHAALEQMLAHLRSQFADVAQLGALRVEAETRAGIERDLRVLLPLVALLLWLAAFAACRSFYVATVPLVVAGLALLWTFGLMGWAGVPITVLSAVLPVLVGAFGTRESMRLITAWNRALPGPGAAAAGGSAPGRRRAAEAMLATLGVPGVVGTLVAAACFAGSAFNDLPMVREFGGAAAIALLLHGAIAAFLVPLMLARGGPLTARMVDVASVRQLTALAERTFLALRQRLSPWVFAVLAGLGGLCLQQAGSLSVSNEPLSFLASGSALARDSARLQREIAGPTLFYVTLEGRADGAFREPENLQHLADIQAFIAKQRVFDRSLSLADILAQANREASGGQPDGYRVPSARALVGQYLLLRPTGDLAPYVSPDFRRATIVVRHRIDDATELNRHVGELRQAIRHFAGPEMSLAIVGENLMRAAAADGLLERQGSIFAALLAVVFVVTSLMFTTSKGGAIALASSAFPVLLVLGIMRLGAIPVNAATLTVTAIALAVAIDSTIHLFSRYSTRCRNAPDYDQAVVETLRDEAPPLVAGGLLLATSFAVLLLSAFSALAQLGLLALAATLFVSVANLLITPLLLARIRLVGLYEILALSEHREQRDALLRSPLFHGMSNYQVRKAILISALRQVADGECLIAQGASGRSLFVVASGQLEVVRRDAEGERRLATLGPGEVIGEIGFVRATQRTADVRALGPVSVLCFDHARLERDLVLFPSIMAKLNFNISGILGKRLAELVEAQPKASPDGPGEAD